MAPVHSPSHPIQGGFSLRSLVSYARVSPSLAKAERAIL